MGFMGIGPMELIMILVIGLLVLGPNKLPGIARALGKAYSEFRRTMNEVNKPVKEFTKEITAEIDDVKKDVNIDKQDIISDLNKTKDDLTKEVKEDKQDIISDLNSTANDLTKDVNENKTDPGKKGDIAS